MPKMDDVEGTKKKKGMFTEAVMTCPLLMKNLKLVETFRTRTVLGLSPGSRIDMSDCGSATQGAD
jgi:hypothetical protein